MRVGRDWWSLDLLNGWHATDEPECLTVVRDLQSGGAFQLSAARKDAGSISSAEVKAMASAAPELMGKPFTVRFGAFRGFSVAYADATGTSWRRYWLAEGRLLVFATYNGPSTVREREVAGVEAMLTTLQSSHGAA